MTPRMIRRALTLVLLAGVTACVHPSVALKYPQRTAEDAARGWSEAFNRDELAQLRLLVHPRKSMAFDQEEARLRHELRTFEVQKYVVGARVIVNGELEGREVDYWYHDGRLPEQRRAVVVESEGRWWLWRF